MTLPKPCPKPDCKAPIAHWYDSFGAPEACNFAMRGKPCACDARDIPCYAPRVTSPLHLPDVDAVARVVREACETWEKAELNDLNDAPLPEAIARAILDLVGARQPVWQRVEPGTRIEAGQRYRRVYADGKVFEGIARCDFLSGNVATTYVQRTIPAPTLTERIRAACNDSPESRITLDVADVEALLDMAGGDPR